MIPSDDDPFDNLDTRLSFSCFVESLSSAELRLVDSGELWPEFECEEREALRMRATPCNLNSPSDNFE